MGDLTIRVLEASNLIPADRNGKSDPYVTVEILEDPMQKKQKTHCHHKTLNPVWHETFTFRAPSPTSTILFKVWDRDLFSRNDPLGNFNVSVGRLSANIPNNMWLDLQGVPHGKLHVEIIYIPRTQAGAPQGVAYPKAAGYPQQSAYPPSGYNQGYNQNQNQNQNQNLNRGPVNSNPTMNYAQSNTGSGYPNSAPYSSAPYGSNPTSSLPNPPPPTSSYQPPTSSYQQPPTSSYQQPPPPTSSYQQPPTSSYQQPPTSSYQQPPTSSYQQPQGDDMGTDYSKLANDFSMNANISSQQSYQQPPPPNYAQPGYPQQSSYPPQQSGYPQSNYPPQQSSYPPQQSGYPQQSNYPPQQSTYPPQQSGYPQQQQPGYPPQQSGYPNIQKGPMVTAQGLMQGPKLTKFFVDVRKKLNRDYIVVMDMSGSMSGSRWEQAKRATMQIAPFACQADPDGITLYLFNGSYKKFDHLVDANQVQNIFSREKPSGTTDLAGVLRAAFQEHFSGNKPTTILVITDGEPNSQSATAKEIVHASQRVNSEEDLSISFIQIGNDRSATVFLKFLDDSLRPQGAKFDIVDTVSANDLGSMSFDQLIQKSIYD